MGSSMRSRGTIGITFVASAALVLGGIGIFAPTAQAITVVDSGTHTYVTETVPGGTTTTFGGQVGSAVTITGSTVVAPLWGAVRMTLRPAPGGRFVTGQIDDHLWTNSWAESFVPQDAPSASFPWVSTYCEHVAPTGYLRVDEASYDSAGTLTTFAAHVRATCREDGAVIDSDIRVASSLPAHAVTFDRLPTFVINSGTYHLNVLNRGNVAEAIGAVTTADVPPGWTVTADRGTCTDVLAARASCSLTVTYTVDGSPGSMTLHVATPDAQSPDLVATVPYLPTVSPAVVTTRSAGDGVHVSWVSPATSYFATAFDVYGSPHGADTWTLLGSTSAPGFSDTTMAPGATVDYRVVSRKVTAAVGVGPVSAVVPGTRGTTTATPDPVVSRITWSTPDATWPGSPSTVASSLADQPDGPGTYPLQAGPSLWSLVQPVPLGGCGRPTGSIVVRELARNAAGTPIRLDATVTGTCADGSPLAGEVRIGVAGTPFATVQIARGALRTPVWLTRTGTILASLANTGPADATLGTPTAAVTGVPATTSLTSTCPATLPVGARCDITVSVTPTSTGDGSLAVTVPGAGLKGSTTLRYPVVARSDTTAPSCRRPGSPSSSTTSAMTGYRRRRTTTARAGAPPRTCAPGSRSPLRPRSPTTSTRGPGRGWPSSRARTSTSTRWARSRPAPSTASSTAHATRSGTPPCGRPSSAGR